MSSTRFTWSTLEYFVAYEIVGLGFLGKLPEANQWLTDYFNQSEACTTQTVKGLSLCSFSV